MEAFSLQKVEMLEEVSKARGQVNLVDEAECRTRFVQLVKP